MFWKARETFVELNAPAIEHHANQVVRSDRGDDVHELLGVVLFVKGLPGGAMVKFR